MNAEQLKQLQAPLKAKYREAPDAAVITLKADGTLGDGMTCSVQTGKALTERCCVVAQSLRQPPTFSISLRP